MRCGAGFEPLRLEPETRKRFARHDPRRDLSRRNPDHLGDERHCARSARIDLEHIDVAILDGVLRVHQAADLERQRQRTGLPVEFGDRLGREIVRRQRAGAIAGMDAGFLDVLHDAGDVGVLAVGQAVDVDLYRVGEIAVDQERPFFRDREFRRPVEIGGQSRDIALELMRVVHDFHGAAAEHIGGPDHDRVADRFGDGAGFFRRGGDAAFGLTQLEPIEQLLEAVAVLGEVDGVG